MSTKTTATTRRPDVPVRDNRCHMFALCLQLMQSGGGQAEVCGTVGVTNRETVLTSATLFRTMEIVTVRASLM